MRVSRRRRCRPVTAWSVTRPSGGASPSPLPASRRRAETRERESGRRTKSNDTLVFRSDPAAQLDAIVHEHDTRRLDLGDDERADRVAFVQLSRGAAGERDPREAPVLLRMPDRARDEDVRQIRAHHLLGHRLGTQRRGGGRRGRRCRRERLRRHAIERARRRRSGGLRERELPPDARRRQAAAPASQRGFARRRAAALRAPVPARRAAPPRPRPAQKSQVPARSQPARRFLPAPASASAGAGSATGGGAGCSTTATGDENASGGGAAATTGAAGGGSRTGAAGASLGTSCTTSARGGALDAAGGSGAAFSRGQSQNSDAPSPRPSAASRGSRCASERKIDDATGAPPRPSLRP